MDETQPVRIFRLHGVRYQVTDVARAAAFYTDHLGFGLTRHVGAIALCFLLYGVYQGIARSVGKALATDLVPSAPRASGLGWYSATTGLLGLVASVVARQPSAVFFYGAAFATAGIVALIRLVPADT